MYGLKISNMISPRSGRPVPNQFIATDKGGGWNGNFIKRETFQSYDTVIAVRTTWPDSVDLEFDAESWDYSTTTSKYRNLFTGLDTAETKRRIKSGEIKLCKLN